MPKAMGTHILINELLLEIGDQVLGDHPTRDPGHVQFDQKAILVSALERCGLQLSRVSGLSLYSCNVVVNHSQLMSCCACSLFLSWCENSLRLALS